MAPTTRSMSARAAMAAGSKVAGSRVSKSSKLKTSRSNTTGSKTTGSKTTGSKTLGSKASGSKASGSKVSRAKASHSSKSVPPLPPKTLSQGLPQAEAVTPFPFLALPDELRNMVYSYFMSSVVITAKKRTFHPAQLGVTQTPESFWPLAHPNSNNSEIWVIRKSLPTALLFTCRTVYMEVAPLFAPLLTELATEPLRFMVAGYAPALALTCAPSPLIACLGAQVQETEPSVLTQNKAIEDFVAFYRCPPKSYTTGDVDIEIAIIPRNAPQSSEMLERVFQGLQARVDEGTPRFRVLIHSLRGNSTDSMPAADLSVGDRVDVVELSSVQFVHHIHDLRRMYLRKNGET